MRKFIGDKAFYNRIFKVMIPIFVQNLITNFVNLLDNLMVGQVGTEPMSGVAIDNQILFVYNLAVFGMLSGAGILGAQYFGKGDIKGVANTFRIKMYSVIVLLISAFAILNFGGDFLIWKFLHEGEAGLNLNTTFAYAQDYMKVMLIGLVPFSISQMYSSTLRETSNAVVPMRAGIIAVFVNLVFNYILIFGKLGAPAFGVVGAAMATVLSRVVECSIIVIWTHTHKEKAAFAVGIYKDLKVPGAVVKKALRMALPLFANEFLWSCGMTTLNQTLSLRGLEVISAVNITSTVTNLFCCAFCAIGMSLGIIVGQTLGSGQLDLAVDEARKITALSCTIATILGVVMIFVAPAIADIYKTEDFVKELAVRFITISALLFPLDAIVNSFYFTLRCGGKSVITFLFDCGYTWVLVIPTALAVVRLTSLPIVICYIIIYGVNIAKFFVGLGLVTRKVWVVNLVGDKDNQKGDLERA